MNTTRLHEIGIFLLSNIFTSKLNSMGIANTPTAISTVRAAWKDKGKKQQGRIVYFAGIFNSLVVVSGLTGRWPWLIKTNAIANIVNSVKESILARRNAESLSEAEVNQESPRKRSMLTAAIKNRFFPSRKKEQSSTVDASNHSSTSSTTSTTSQTSNVPVSSSTATSASSSSSLKNRFFASQKLPKDSMTATANKASAATADNKQQAEPEKYSKRKKTVKKAQSLLAGKRESAMDDMIWGIFQISMIFFDFTRWQAIGHAWMVFLLHVLEETALNEKLTRKQKMRKFGYLTITAYVSGRLVFSYS